VKLVFDHFAHKANLGIFTVVKYTIIEYKLYIMQKLVHLHVLIVLKLLLHSTKVHRLLHYVKVIGNVELHRVNWLVENPGVLMLPKVAQESLGCFVPTIIDLDVVWHFLD
jgi:hypothetical protein